MGSMMGALAFAVIKPKNPIRALMFGVPLVTAMLICVPFLPTLPGTVAAISLTGFGLYLAFASLTVSMHLEVDDFYRGRMGSVIGLGFSAIGPLMSFPWGHLADHIGPPLTIWIGAGIFGLGSLVLALVDRRPGQSGLAAESALNRP
jgi:predicted MFS family arabinose efflux permease